MIWGFWSSGSQKEPDGNKDHNSSSPAPSSRDTAFDQTPTSRSTSTTANQTSRPAGPSRATGDSAHDWNASLNATNWSHFLEPQTLIPTTLLVSGILFAVHIHRRFLRRIPTAPSIAPGLFRNRSLLGVVTRVGDGDNFRLFHTPGGRMLGWGWLRKVPTDRKQLKDKTIHVRIAGIDAPELAHFGNPAQPFGREALEWLQNYLLYRRVRVHLLAPDQYGRVVATVFARNMLGLRRDVGLLMLRRGLATVYEAKSGAEFGNAKREQMYRKAEAWAEKRKRGLWEQWNGESPRNFKKRMAESDTKKA